MHSIRLERVRRHLNEERFYDIEIFSDLFGLWLVEFRWGRIGREPEPSVRRQSFADEGAARAVAEGQCRAKLRGGYRAVRAVGDWEARLQPKDDVRVRRLRVAEALEQTLGAVPGLRETRFGRISAALASACRVRPRQGRTDAGEQRPSLAFRPESVDDRVRAMVFALMDELVRASLTDEDEHAVRRVIQTLGQGAGQQAGGQQMAVRMVPRARYPLLDLSLAAFFVRDRKLSDLAISLAGRGVRFLGDLVQLDAEALRQVSGARDDVLEGVEAALKAVGLGLGARVPGWRAPQHSALSA